ncbi:uncharacterized protein LOC142767491 [Rhipicephalus microplus]|uniref:uncharacterized protein LOC142767491 n=1 Tax=Rhipicephalus microplus TaxID=6941 RepID=UPI003F6C7AA9
MPSGGPSYGSYCCVSWCFNNGRTHKKPGTSFFRIPRDSRMKAWMQYAGRDDLLSKPASLLYATYRVCSDHFTAQSFMDPWAHKAYKNGCSQCATSCTMFSERRFK